VLRGLANCSIKIGSWYKLCFSKLSKVVQIEPATIKYHAERIFSVIGLNKTDITDLMAHCDREVWIILLTRFFDLFLRVISLI